MTNTAYAVITGVGGNPPVSSLTDNFSGSALNTAKWTSWTEGAGASLAVASNELQISVSTTEGWAGVYSAAAYDLTGSQASVNIAELGTANTSGSQTQIGFLLQAGQTYPEHGACLRFILTQGYFFCQYQPDATLSDSVTIYSAGPGSYEETNWAWWRFSERDGTISWDVSPDGSTWTSLGTVATRSVGFSVTSVYPTLYGDDNSGGSASTVAFSNFNTAEQPAGSGTAAVSISATVLSPSGTVIASIPALKAEFGYGATVEQIRESLVTALQEYLNDPTVEVEFIAG